MRFARRVYELFVICHSEVGERRRCLFEFEERETTIAVI